MATVLPPASGAPNIGIRGQAAEMTVLDLCLESVVGFTVPQVEVLI